MEKYKNDKKAEVAGPGILLIVKGKCEWGWLKRWVRTFVPGWIARCAINRNRGCRGRIGLAGRIINSIPFPTKFYVQMPRWSQEMWTRSLGRRPVGNLDFDLVTLRRVDKGSLGDWTRVRASRGASAERWKEVVEIASWREFWFKWQEGNPEEKQSWNQEKSDNKRQEKSDTKMVEVVHSKCSTEVPEGW